MTQQQVEDRTALALRKFKTLNADAPRLILSEKAKIIRRTGLLKYVEPPAGGLSLIGGCEAVKQHIIRDRACFTEEARAFGIPAPRGLMLTGVSGCGKTAISLSAASELGIPLLQFDVGNMMSKWVGESERNTREAVQQVEAMAPCVLQLDEVESRMLRQLTGVNLPAVRVEALKVRVLQGGICAGLLFSLFMRTRETWTAWPAMLLILALVGFEIFSFRRLGGSAGSGAASAEAKVEVHADSGLLLDAVAAALDAIDRAIGDTGVPGDDRSSGATDRAPIESVPELLAVIQDLLGEALQEDATLALKRSKELPTVLARFGVQVQSYEAAERESSGDTQSLDLFDREPSLDAAVTAPVTLKPALVRNGKVLKRGRVMMPAGEANRASAH